MLGLAGAVTTVVSLVQNNPVALYVGLGVLALSAAWYWSLKWWRRRRRRRPQALVVPSGGRAYLRGLLPFEHGDALLGRERDVPSLLAKVTNSEFRFGYVSGEAGSGKTSLLRAGLIPELKKLDWAVVYLPRLGEDPTGTLLKAATRELGLPPGEGPRSLRDALVAFAEQHPGRKVLIICDQFDEFCIARRTASSRAPLIDEIGDCYADGDLPVSFLLGLRKEFVDDLQDFSSRIPQPLDARYRHRLRNWEPGEARAVLDAAAEHDRVPFADALRDDIIRDLGRGGEVRPVELQLVASRLGELNIYEPAGYRAMGGTHGILSNYVKEVIEPDGVQTPELERQLARHLLRSLCAETADAKRPTGLRFEELAQRIRATLGARGMADLVRDTERYEEALRRVLRKCEAAYLVISEDEQTYNLIHDYIVRSIRDATADIETVEEQANRLLDQYLEDERRHLRRAIPTSHYRFIKRYASRERKVEPPAARLLAKTRRHLVLRVASVATGVFLLLSIILPRGTHIVRQPFDVSHDRWVISTDRRLAVSFKENGASFLWELGKPWESRTGLGIKFRNIIISPHSKFLLGITADGKIYVWRPEEKLSPDSKPVLTISPRSEEDTNDFLFWRDFGGFSPDDEWVYAASMEGELYLWRPGETPAPLYTMEDPKTFHELPRIAFSPHAKFVAIFDPVGKSIHLGRLRPFSGRPIRLDDKLPFESNYVRLKFSHDDDWLIFSGVESVRVANLTDFPKLALTSMLLDANRLPFYAYQFAFSPRDEWVVARATYQPLYAWRLRESGVVRPQPLFNQESNHNYGMVAGADISGVDFSPDGKWAAGLAQNWGIYVWLLDEPPAGVVEPAVPKGKGSSSLSFSPGGEWLAGCTIDGGVYIWKPGETPDISDPAARHGVDYVTLVWGVEGRHLFTYGGSDVYWGEVTDKLQPVVREKSPVVGIAVPGDRRQLVVLGENHVSIMERRFYFWGVPVYTRPWPALAPREGRGS